MLDVAALRTVATFRDLPEDDLQWLVGHAEELNLAPGEFLVKEADPADYMFVLLSGDMQFRRNRAGSAVQTLDVGTGDVTGMLPYSRLKNFGGTGRALTPLRVARFHKDIFPEMMQRSPLLGERLVSLMLDRVREVTRSDEQQQKLASLGKMAAGLAHELNNPAGAVQRAAKSLVTIRSKLRVAYLKIDQRELTTAQRKTIADFENEALTRAVKETAVPARRMEQADREEDLCEWLDAHGVEEGYRLAGGLVESRVTPGELESLSGAVGIEGLTDVLNRIDLVILAARLVGEIEVGANRITELVKSIKEYTYMDQAAEQEIDIHGGIENTLTMLGFKLRKKSVNVIREYDRELPKICAFGAELNQVWTNLMVNAIDAMPPVGELRIKTWGDPTDIYVEVKDNGSGISPENTSRIFEPFFTTKGVGEGTGLGLDTVQRIVRKHRGEISVESKSGDTRFTIRLPKQARR